MDFKASYDMMLGYITKKEGILQLLGELISAGTQQWVDEVAVLMATMS